MRNTRNLWASWEILPEVNEGLVIEANGGCSLVSCLIRGRKLKNLPWGQPGKNSSTGDKPHTQLMGTTWGETGKSMGILDAMGHLHFGRKGASVN